MPKRKAAEISLPFTWEKAGPGVTVVRIPYKPNKNWRQYFLLSSDRHIDNPHSNREMQADHLNEALAKKAGVIDNGDMFCAMQGKYDKRSDKSDLRPEHQSGDYLDRLVQTTAEWWAPWRQLLLVCGSGNHESQVKERHETDLSQRFCGLMNAAGGNVINGGYGGFVKFQFRQDHESGKSSRWQSVVLHYDHGFGGGGPVTADMTQAFRRQNYLPDADIIWTGHTHDEWQRWVARKRLSEKNVIYQDAVLHLKTTTYKDDYGDGTGGWHVRTGKPPKTLGATWLVFKWSERDHRVVFDVERAS